MTHISRRTALTAALAATLAAQIPLSAMAQDAPVVEVKDFSLGAPDAKVKITEYASFTCPHCAHFHETNMAKLKAEYIDTGKVQFTYREVYFDRYGLWAAMIARCGGEMKYFGISDMLYDGQKDWLASGEDAGIADALRKIGISAGMTADQVNACLNDNAKMQAMVTAYQTNATNDKVQGTPTFIIDGQSYSGEMSYADFAKILDEKLND